MIVQSFGALQTMTDPIPRWASSDSLNLYGLHQAYATIYATQPNVRICVDFLARNIAELSFQIFRRVSDTDRERLADHDLARWLGNPNPTTRRYRLMEGTIADLAIYFNAYWLKVRSTEPDGRPRIGLVRLPPEEMTVNGGILPSGFTWTRNGRRKEFALSEIVYFNGYNPTDPLVGLSPMETLRRILAEEEAASDHRESYWRNAGRMEGVWERDKDSPTVRWTETQWADWRRQWQEFAGGGSRSGMTAVGPLGATLKQYSFSPKDSEYIQGGKLRREVCAASWHIPQPLVGILEHATFSNIKEQHKHLYQDTLGPTLRMLKEEIEAQLLIECDDQTDVYGEFNIDQKLAGTPEERAASLQMSIGRPWRTVNEGRALDNLPRIDDPAMDTVAPQQGGPATNAQPADTAPSDTATGTTTPPAAPDDANAIQVDRVLQAWQRRVTSHVARVPEADRATAFDAARWSHELAMDLTPLIGEYAAIVTATHHADHTQKSFLVEALSYA